MKVKPRFIELHNEFLSFTKALNIMKGKYAMKQFIWKIWSTTKALANFLLYFIYFMDVIFSCRLSLLHSSYAPVPLKHKKMWAMLFVHDCLHILLHEIKKTLHVSWWCRMTVAETVQSASLLLIKDFCVGYTGVSSLLTPHLLQVHFSNYEYN